MAAKIFITAAEVSGDLHASHLIRALRQIRPDLVIEGHGGTKMLDAGATIHTQTTANAAMGFSAVRRVKEMFALLRWTRKYYKSTPPALQICVDSPALNFHFAKIAHTAGVPVLYYVAPQLWAWREGRMKKVRKWVDRLACVLPFEEKYFRAHEVKATFVGHPLFDEFASPLTPSPGSPGKGGARASSGKVRLFGDSPVIGLLAGSRRAEALKNFPRMLEVAEAIHARFSKVHFLLPTTQATHPIVSAYAATSPIQSHFEIRQDAFDEMVPKCDLVVTVSGTATLHVALHNVPMIVVYHGGPITWNAMGRWLVKTRTYSLVNLLAADPALAASGRITPDMHIVPEFIPWYGSTKPVSDYALELLAHPQGLHAQRASLSKLITRMNHPGASKRVAKMALEMIDAKAPA
jgi:lipid-A-disaccharide synthase